MIEAVCIFPGIAFLFTLPGLLAKWHYWRQKRADEQFIKDVNHDRT